MGVIHLKGRHHLPSILQTEHSECSLACLAMISGYYGHRIDINTLRNKFSVSSRGVTLKTIIKTAERMNLASRAIRLDINEIHKLKLPAVLHWDMNHFVVLKKVSFNRVVIHDPARGTWSSPRAPPDRPGSPSAPFRIHRDASIFPARSSNRCTPRGWR